MKASNLIQQTVELILSFLDTALCGSHHSKVLIPFVKEPNNFWSQRWYFL